MLCLRSRFPLALGLLALACLMSSVRLAAWQIDPLTITTPSLPGGEAGIPYQVTLQVRGGVNPYTWQLAQGSSLPPGLRLHQHSGRIDGTPTAAGQYHFTLTLSDVNAPPSHVQRDFTVVVVAKDGGLEESTKGKRDIHCRFRACRQPHRPARKSDGDRGGGESNRPCNRAGYQHFTIPPQAQQEILFGATPGAGSYRVRADAIASFTTGKVTLRAHKQTGQGELVIRSRF